MRASESICCSPESLDKPPGTQEEAACPHICSGETALFSTSTLAFPGSQAKTTILQFWGWLFQCLHAFFHPASSGKLPSGSTSYLWSLKHSSVPSLEKKKFKTLMHTHPSEQNRQMRRSWVTPQEVFCFFFPFFSERMSLLTFCKCPKTRVLGYFFKKRKNSFSKTLFNFYLAFQKFMGLIQWGACPCFSHHNRPLGCVFSRDFWVCLTSISDSAALFWGKQYCLQRLWKDFRLTGALYMKYPSNYCYSTISN